MAVLDAELRLAGVSWGWYLGAVRDVVPSGVSVGIMPSVPQLLDAVGAYLDQGYRRIKLKIQPGWDVAPSKRSASASVTSFYRSTPTPPTPWRTPVTWPGSTRSAFCSSNSHCPKTTSPGMPSWRADADARSAWTSRSLRPGLRPMPSSAGRVPWSISRPDGSAATWRLAGFMMSAPPSGCRSGAEGCSRPGSAGPPTWRWRPCPTSPSPVTSRPQTATGGTTSPRRSASTTAIRACRPVPAWASPPTPDALAEVTTSSERMPVGSWVTSGHVCSAVSRRRRRP